MRRMKTAPVLLVIAALTACGGTKEAATDSAAAAPVASAEPAAPAAKTVADFAGTWQMTSNVQGAAKPVSSTLVSGTGNSWTLTLEGRPAMQVQMSMSGDSLITQSPEYESVLRKGVKVTTRTAVVMSGETITGNMEAVYRTPKGEERVPGTITGTRTAK